MDDEFDRAIARHILPASLTSIEINIVGGVVAYYLSGFSRASCLMCDSLHPFRVHANHLTTTKTDRYGLMVPYTFFSFPRQVQCLPGIFVSRPSLSRFRVGEFTAFPSLERPCQGQALSGCGLGNSSVVPEPFFPSGTPECLAKRIRKFRRAQQSQKYFQDGKKNL